jgi:LPXTG-motif cell wall-anchored protein
MSKVARRIRSLAVLAIAVVAVMAMSVGTAMAQYPPAEPFAVDCVAAGEAGASVTCTVTGAVAGETLTASAEVQGTVFWTEVLSADAEGEATFRFTVPPQHRGQEITVRVEGAVSGLAASDTVTVAAPGRTGESLPRSMPRTGQDALLLGALGVVLLAGGVTALRRRSATKDHTHAGV